MFLESWQILVVSYIIILLVSPFLRKFSLFYLKHDMQRTHTHTQHTQETARAQCILRTEQTCVAGPQNVLGPQKPRTPTPTPRTPCSPGPRVATLS